MSRDGQADGRDNAKRVQFESINPFGELETEEMEEPAEEQGIRDEEDDELPRLPDSDEHGKKGDQRRTG